MPNLVELIKTAATQAVDNSMPAGVYYGTVVGVSPLKINIEQRFTLERSDLLLSSLVQDFSVDMAVDSVTENTGGGSGESSFASHSHAYRGTKTFTVKLGLKSGEKVILLRVQGGQKYLVLDRVR